MKKFFLLWSLVSFVASCEEDFVIIEETYDNTETVALNFVPREVSQVWLIPGKYDNGDKGHFYALTESDSATVACSNLFLEVLTSDQLPAAIYLTGFGETFNVEDEDRLPDLEVQIEEDFFNYYASTRLNLKDMEYRTDAVEALEITADQTLFGVPAGQSLNDYLTIIYYDPYYICGSNEQLLYGIEADDQPTCISDWLALDPLAQPSMDLMFRSVPDELPQKVCFTVTLRKDNGEELSYTLSPLTLLAE